VEGDEAEATEAVTAGAETAVEEDSGAAVVMVVMGAEVMVAMVVAMVAVAVDSEGSVRD
jgi:hypothetical protein